MDADISTLLYTVLIDIFIFIVCYILWIMVSESAPLATNIFLPHTWKYKLIARNIYEAGESVCCGLCHTSTCDWLIDGLCCWRHKHKPKSLKKIDLEKKEAEEQREMREAVAGVVVSEAEIAALEKMNQNTVDTNATTITMPPLAPVREEMSERSSERSQGQKAVVGHVVVTTPGGEVEPVDGELTLPSPKTGGKVSTKGKKDEDDDDDDDGTLSPIVVPDPPHPDYNPEASIFEPTEPVTKENEHHHSRDPSRTAISPQRKSTAISLHHRTASRDPTTPAVRTFTIQEALGTNEPVIQVLRKNTNATSTRPRFASVASTGTQAASTMDSKRHERYQSTASSILLQPSTNSPGAHQRLASTSLAVPMEQFKLESGSDSPKRLQQEERKGDYVAIDVDASHPNPDTPVAEETAPAEIEMTTQPNLSIQLPTQSPDDTEIHNPPPILFHLEPEKDEAKEGEPQTNESTQPPSNPESPPTSTDDKGHDSVTVVPVQEGVQISQQVLVTPPRSKLRFWLVEPILEKIFPPIRVLGANAIDGYIYLKFSQLLIFVTGVMSILCVGILVPVHELQNTNPDAAFLTEVSVISVPSGSRWFIVHFIIAFVFLILIYLYVRLLARHAVKATKLSTAITDDNETIAARRTIHVKSIGMHDSHITEDLIRSEIAKLMPTGTHQDSNLEILSVSLFHDVHHIIKYVNKKAEVIDQIERLEILASEVQHHPGAKIKRVWLKVLHAPGTLSVKERLETLKWKKDKYTRRIVEEIWRYYELTADNKQDEKEFEAVDQVEQEKEYELEEKEKEERKRMKEEKRKAKHMKDHPKSMVSHGSIESTLSTAPSNASSTLQLLQPTPCPPPSASPPVVRCAPERLASPSSENGDGSPERLASPPLDPNDLLSSPSPALENGVPTAAKASHGKFRQKTRSTLSPFTGQAFVSFRASALAGEVIKKHRETRHAVRIKLDHFGLRAWWMKWKHRVTNITNSDEATHAPIRNDNDDPEPPTLPPDDSLHRSWNISFAPKPSDILWNNLASHENVVMNYSRWLVANAGLITLVLFVAMPTLILGQITGIIKSQTSNLDPNHDIRARVLLFFTSYLTSLIMWVIFVFYSPYIMTTALDFERHVTKSAYGSSRFFKNSLFNLVNIILLPIFAQSTIANLIGSLQLAVGTSTWYQILGNAFFVNSGLYFAQFFSHSIFVNCGFGLLDFPTYMRRVWRLRTALTKKDFEHAHEPPGTGCSYERLITCFGLILWLSICVPLLVPFGLTYFIAQYNMDLYNFRHFKLTPAMNKGVIPTLVARYTLLYFGFWQLLMSAFFYTQNLSSYYLIALFFLILSICTFSIYAFREFSTHIPIELHISALRHLDEKITIFAELDRILPDLHTESVSVSHVLHQEHEGDGSQTTVGSTQLITDGDPESIGEAAAIGEHINQAEDCDLEQNEEHQHSIVLHDSTHSAPGSGRNSNRNSTSSMAIKQQQQLDEQGRRSPSLQPHDPLAADDEKDKEDSVHSPKPDTDHLMVPPRSDIADINVARPPIERQASISQSWQQVGHHDAPIHEVNKTAYGAKPPHKHHRERLSSIHRRSLEIFFTNKKEQFTHPHIHRPPLSHSHSHSHVIHSQLRHLSHVDQSICPDCLYRHPIWKQIEKDDEVMKGLKEREELLIRQREAEAAAVNAIHAQRMATANNRPDMPYTTDADEIQPLHPDPPPSALVVPDDPVVLVNSTTTKDSLASPDAPIATIDESKVDGPVIKTPPTTTASSTTTTEAEANRQDDLQKKRD